jgi:hypothetical protein
MPEPCREGPYYNVEIIVRKEYIPINVLSMLYVFVTVRPLDKEINKKSKYNS